MKSKEDKIMRIFKMMKIKKQKMSLQDKDIPINKLKQRNPSFKIKVKIAIQATLVLKVVTVLNINYLKATPTH